MGEFFRIESAQTAHVLELMLPDLIDPLEFDQLNESVLAALDGRTDGRWVLDLTRVTYMGSAMLGLIVNVRQRIKGSGGRLVLCGLSSRLLEIFRASSMERLFVVARSRPEALKLTVR